MKIIIGSEGFPIDGYPNYVFVEKLVKALADRGNEIIVIAPQSIVKSIVRKIPLFPRKEIRKTIHGKTYIVYRPIIFSFGKYKLLEKLTNWYKRIKIEGILSKIGNIDALYGHFWHNARLMEQYAYKNKLPLFVACGEGDDALENMVLSMSDSDKKMLARVVTGVISVSTENKRKCLEYGLITEDKIDVFPNSVEKNVFYPMDKEQCRLQLGIDINDFVVVYVGSFIHRKGCKRLAEAIDRIDNIHLKVMFLGKPMGGDCCTPNCKGIIFCTTVDHDKLPLYLNAADIFVLPTLNEGCCNAIVEAASCGLPIISSNLPFNDDILDNTNSIKVDPMNINQISEAIVLLMDNIALRDRLSKGSIRKTDTFSIAHRAENIERFIKKHIE